MSDLKEPTNLNKNDKQDNKKKYFQINSKSHTYLLYSSNKFCGSTILSEILTSKCKCGPC